MAGLHVMMTQHGAGTSTLLDGWRRVDEHKIHTTQGTAMHRLSSCVPEISCDTQTTAPEKASTESL
jgi:hypothetical protein